MPKLREANGFKVGDVVHLKSGSPSMVIELFVDESFDVTELVEDAEFASVAFFCRLRNEFVSQILDLDILAPGPGDF